MGKHLLLVLDEFKKWAYSKRSFGSKQSRDLTVKVQCRAGRIKKAPGKEAFKIVSVLSNIPKSFRQEPEKQALAHSFVPASLYALSHSIICFYLFNYLVLFIQLQAIVSKVFCQCQLSSC